MTKSIGYLLFLDVSFLTINPYIYPHSLQVALVYTTHMTEIFSAYEQPIVVALVVMVIALTTLTIHLELRLRRFMRGNNGANLESTIQRLVKELSEAQGNVRLLLNTSAEFRALQPDSVRGMSVIRFNALTGDTSGNQSFATAIVSEAGNGILISSLHAREHARMYAKSLKNFSSEVELTTEEKQAIVEARKHLG